MYTQSLVKLSMANGPCIHEYLSQRGITIREAKEIYRNL